ncbi:glycosyltransferase [Paenibacillus pabuli]|uniref:glycosyltransferase n=1 Tax=Paenibacillus pabuli TaxID=1472 RepID=UPI001FFEE16B|nr:glycosyltransferase [Paenibacillus pabuli]UPK43235.1 glycosyltransferase [Paenibacillus pabuli]
MKASVIILSYNQREVIKACLSSLSRQRIDDGDQYEVVIVDNGSQDGTGEMIGGLTFDFPILYYYVPRTAESSRATARNKGITNASGDVVVFLDGDQLAEPNFIYEHLRVHKLAKGKLVIGFRRYLSQSSMDLTSLKPGWVNTALSSSEEDERFLLMKRFSENGSAFRTAWHLFFSCNFSVDRELMIQSGMFDEGFKGWGLEDSELGYRLQKDGGAFVFNKNALTFHIYHASEFDESRHLGWKTNMDYFLSLHPTFEVQAQYILEEFFNPEIRNSWWDCYVRFEQVVRVYQGYEGDRLPVSVIVVYERRPEVLQAIAAEAVFREVVVIDKTTSSDLDILCQFIENDFDVLYYKQPSEDDLIELYHRLAVRGIVKHEIFKPEEAMARSNGRET